MANAIDPTMVRKSDSRPRLVDLFLTTTVSRRVVVGGGGWWWWWWRITAKWVQRTMASTFLWRCDSTHAYRGPISTCVFKFIPQWLYLRGKRPRFPLKRRMGVPP